MQQIAYAESQAQAEEQRDSFVQWCQKEGCRAAGDTLVRDWERMVTFYQFPKEHWKHLRTTNPVESPFAGLRTAAAKRYKKVNNTTAVIWKMLLLGERKFHRLNAPERMKQVYLGIRFRDGMEVKQKELVAA